MVAGVFPRGSIEDVLSRPGNEALTAGDVIAANGTSLTPEQVAAAMSGEGLVIESDVLTPNTEYVLSYTFWLCDAFWLSFSIRLPRILPGSPSIVFSIG